MKIQLMESNHWLEVKSIYQAGIKTGNATFEENPPETWELWKEKFIPACSLVCLDEKRVIGWGAVSLVSSRCVYQGVGDISIYVAPEYQGSSIGSRLLETLISVSEEEGIWTLQAGIFPENKISLQLHMKHGFKEVGKREKIGKMTHGPYVGQWRDVILLERRSAKAGID
jgi:phosphinothricin acetyltransferase